MEDLTPLAELLSARHFERETGLVMPLESEEVQQRWQALSGKQLDPVARFHLGNGASLHAIHWAADLSDKGLQQSAGLMVNYLYDLSSIEENHDSYFDQGEIATSRDVARLLS